MHKIVVHSYVNQRSLSHTYNQDSRPHLFLSNVQILIIPSTILLVFSCTSGEVTAPGGKWCPQEKSSSAVAAPPAVREDLKMFEQGEIKMIKSRESDALSFSYENALLCLVGCLT